MKINRRQFIQQSTAEISSSILGLGWLDPVITQDVRGENLADTRQYDAAMMDFYNGDPSQVDSFEAKPQGSGNRCSAVQLPGISDRCSEPIHF
tara:strand:- start:117 stop:395 length:279 start_codon:yes stop_codon:yes gene_type:complete